MSEHLKFWQIQYNNLRTVASTIYEGARVLETFVSELVHSFTMSYMRSRNFHFTPVSHYVQFWNECYSANVWILRRESSSFRRVVANSSPSSTIGRHSSSFDTDSTQTTYEWTYERMTTYMKTVKHRQ